MSKKSSLSGNILNMFADIVCTEIASRLLDGVHWVVLENNIKNKNTIARILQLRRELDAKGYASDSILDVVKLSNGYLFNLDKDECYIMFDMLLKHSNTSEFNNLLDYIPKLPDKNLEKSKLELAKLCYTTFFNKNKDTLDVCMYNTNNYGKISLNASILSGDRVSIKYNAFYATVNDLDYINKKYLANKGMRISSSKLMEILDNSVRVRLTLDRFDKEVG